MSRQQQLHFMRPPYVRARAVAQVQEQNQHKITMMIAYALLSAIIVLWLAYLPTLTGSILTNLHIVPTHLSSASDSVNRTNMDNRRASAGFDDRWNAFATPTIKMFNGNGVRTSATDPAEDFRQVPVGCEAAFSQLIIIENSGARCVASADIATARVN
jgi:CRISPR/Cas system endoribonuclease Cas6 (RAMP superfamily)